jgi:hypothetical protein
MRRLQVHNRYAFEALDAQLRDLFNLDLEQLYHRNVFRSGHAAI